MPNNFDAYLAFDYAGNPPIHLWTKQLRAAIPINWFNIFEEARHMQRRWNISYWDPEPNAVMWIDNNQQQPVNVNGYDDGYLEIRELTEYEQQFDSEEDNDEQSNTAETSLALNDDENMVPQPSITKIITPKKNLLLSELPTELDPSLAHPILSPVPKFTTPAMRLQNQYTRSTSDVPQQQQQQQSTIEEKQSLPVTKLETKPSKSDNTQRTITTPTRPEVRQRRSFSSFFLKKKKSKKSLNEDKPSKRKSTPPDVPTAEVSTKQHQSNQHSNPSTIEIPVRRKSNSFVKNQNIEVFESVQSDNSDTSDKLASSLSSPTIKTPKNDAIDIATTNKIELFDMESYFDMQATFAFLNDTSTDGFSLMNLSNTTTKTNA